MWEKISIISTVILIIFLVCFIFMDVRYRDLERELDKLESDYIKLYNYTPKEIIKEVEVVKGIKYIGNFKITNYCVECNGVNGEYKNKTATGIAKSHRTVAVDKSIIPLGTHLIIQGEEYIAEDTGVTGNVIDIFVDNHNTETSYYADVYIKE